MSIFGTEYQRGFNAALGQQTSERLCRVLRQRREQGWAQRQSDTQQGLMQAVQLQILQLQQENARLRQDNAEYERFANWAMNTIDERDQEITDLQSETQRWKDFAFQ